MRGPLLSWPSPALPARARPFAVLAGILAACFLVLIAPHARAGVADLVFASGFEAIPVTACRASGAACGADGECCSSFCDRPSGGGTGQCAVTGGCLIAGEPCGTAGVNGSCCSNACLEDGAGAPATCQRIGGCLPTGEICSLGAQCCSGSCAPAGTTLDGRAILRCAANASCSSPGELCLASSANCCPPGGGSIGCEVGTTGLARCLGGAPGCVLPGNACSDVSECCTETFPGIACQAARGGGNACCLPAGQSCAFGDTCCSGICAPDGSGALACRDQRAATGEACTTSADCAVGCCERNPAGALACTTACAVCTAGQLGESCSASSPCCPGLGCDAMSATCRFQ